MRNRSTLLFLFATSLAAFGGCASQAVVLKPDPIPFATPAAGQNLPQTWSLWVAGARDNRAAGRTGPKAGVLYSRFRKTPQNAYVEPNPEIYVREQLARYLLKRGWEASSAGTARALLHIEVEDFSFVEDPGSVWDHIGVRVVYGVRILNAADQEVGRVRLEGASQFDTAGDTERAIEKALSSALADTFEAFSRSDVLRSALAQIGG